MQTSRDHGWRFETVGTAPIGRDHSVATTAREPWWFCGCGTPYLTRAWGAIHVDWCYKGAHDLAATPAAPEWHEPAITAYENEAHLQEIILGSPQLLPAVPTPAVGLRRFERVPYRMSQIA